MRHEGIQPPEWPICGGNFLALGRVGGAQWASGRTCLAVNGLGLGRRTAVLGPEAAGEIGRRFKTDLACGFTNGLPLCQIRQCLL